MGKNIIHPLRTIAITALCLSFICSCDKKPMNDDLDGNWQLLDINYKNSTGIYDSIVSKKEQKVFFAFQLKLMNVSNILSRFRYTKDSLFLYDFYRRGYPNDTLITDEHTKILNDVGIDGNKADFKIETLNSHTLKLSSDYAKLLFRKF